MRKPDGARAEPARTLRTRFIIAAAISVVLPLAAFGVWLNGSLRDSGTELLTSHLETSLSELSIEIGRHWVHRESDLLLLARNIHVQQALIAGLAPDDPAAEPLGRFLMAAYAQVQDAVEGVVYRDSTGRALWVLAEDPGGNPGFNAASEESASAHLAAGIPVTVTIVDDATGRTIGSMETGVRLAAVLPPGTLAGAVPDGVVAILLDTGARLLTPAPINPDLLRQPRFDHDGGEWLVARRMIESPALVLAAAAPLGPYTAPFERKARLGMAGLLTVVLLGMAATAVATKRLTRSLERLAGAADAVARGDLGRRVEVDSRDEVGRVAVAFNEMADNLGRMLHVLSQKDAMAAVGEFAGTLAHEIRNPLTSIRIDLQRLEEHHPPGSELHEPLFRALVAIDRLDHTVTTALQAARTGDTEREVLDLYTVLEAAIARVRPECNARSAVVRFEYVNRPLPVAGDHAALERLFINLLLNAVQSTDTDGTTEVGTTVDHDSITVIVRDRGRGMTEEVLARAFEPFFSTRPDGTGLGLGIARRITRAHGGELDIESRPGSGTTVRVQFPRHRNKGAGDDANGVERRDTNGRPAHGSRS